MPEAERFHEGSSTDATRLSVYYATGLLNGYQRLAVAEEVQ